ncbi:MAG: hypothetical protein R3D29_08515 [Nitratireductor sp.]
MADICKGLTNRPFADFDRINKPKPFKVSIRLATGREMVLLPLYGRNWAKYAGKPESGTAGTSPKCDVAILSRFGG